MGIFFILKIESLFPSLFTYFFPHFCPSPNPNFGVSWGKMGLDPPPPSNCERETCSLCSKFIYKHQPVVVCSMDGNIYHSNCLGFCKDTCFHIQSGTIPDWMCPTCSREVFPCYDDIPDLSYVKCICYNCRLSRGESGLT